VITLDEKKTMESYKLEKGKITYLLDDIITPSLNVGVYTKFKSLLKVMEDSNNAILTTAAKRLGM